MVVDAVNFPDVPVTVKLAVPAAADDAADSVRMLKPVDGFGVKDAVTPAGKPETLRFTPAGSCGAPGGTNTLIEPEEVLPGANCIKPGPDNVKLGAEIVSEKVVETVCVPHVPLIVTVLVPGAAVLSAERLRAVFWLVGFSANDPVTPVGNPLIASLTLPVKPNSGFNET